MKTLAYQYRPELQSELRSILQFWMAHSVDTLHGGFYGKIDENNMADPYAPKGSVLNSRILWTFSAAYNQTHDEHYREVADKAYEYIISHFIDKQYGGLYWTVDYEGNPLDDKKQIYATAFGIYALSEYYKIHHYEEVKSAAIQLFREIENYSYDMKETGYIEAMTREWKEIDDARLSKKDANEKKTMNTHLHILEAYTNLFKIWQDNGLKNKMMLLLRNFTDHIIDPVSNHLIPFFDEHWHRKSNVVSFGHDIEASWLLQEAAEAINEPNIIKITKQLSLKIAEATLPGIDEDGGLWYEKEKDIFIKEKHWWPQAEAMVGFMNVYQNFGNENYLQQSYKSWQFIKQYIKSPQGEWLWGINEDHTVMQGQDKAGIWKCPYHNGRACMEISERISRVMAERF